MDRNDRRVKRTQHLLAEALIALTLTKGYEAVTIRDITERADVGYATFFRHYPDKEALFQDVIEGVLAKLIELLQRQTPDGDGEAEGLLIFSYVQEHSELCRVLLSNRGSIALLNRIRAVGVRSALQEHAPLDGSPIPPEIAANHLVASSIALIQWWLEQNMPYPPARMAAIYNALIAAPTRALALRPEPSTLTAPQPEINSASS
jgi:AcrR family transcriptional regulator